MTQRIQKNFTQRQGAAVTVSVVYSESRYSLGELVIRTVYRCANGSVDHEVIPRIYLGMHTGPAIRQLWNTMFDAVLIAQEYAPSAISIRLRIDGAPALWRARVRAIAEVVAEELKIALRGTSADIGERGGRPT